MTPISGITLQNLEKSFGKSAALRGVSFSLNKGDILALLGPSGCGKTTTLRCVAGLEQPTSGLIAIGDQVVYSSEQHIMVPPEQRKIGLVFQSYALWPHFTVWENLAYGLQLQRIPKSAIETRVTRILDMVGLLPFKDRYPGTLSGGQQQRVALCRSLVTEPEVLLMDEPLSNLDMKMREHMRAELRALIKNLGLTVIYVTHDPSEALLLADHIALMQDGQVAECNSPTTLYARPTTRTAFQFLGQTNCIAGRVVGERDGQLVVKTDLHEELLVVRRGSEGPGEYTLGIRPENIGISAVVGGAPGVNQVLGEIIDATFLGNVTYYDVTVNAAPLRVQCSQPMFSVGQKVTLHLPPEWLVTFPAAQSA